MLSKLIVSSYGMLIEVSLWLFLLIALVSGWKVGGGVLGGVVGLLLGFVFGVMFFGAFLVLSDIRTSVRAIEARTGAPKA